MSADEPSFARRAGADRAAGWLQQHLGACVAAIVVILGASFTAVATWRTTFAIFGRDQGSLQYVAWAMGQGERVYVDFREINGPLIHVIHWVFQRLGGADEHVFRLLDVAVSSLVFLFVGASIPGIARTQPSAEGARQGGRTPPRRERAAWACAAWVVLMAQYVAYGWWQTAQRESFYDLFLLPSTALALLALAPHDGEYDRRARRRRRTLFVAAGLLGALTWLAKPTCVLYSAVQGVIILLDRDGPEPRKSGLLAFATGCATALIATIAFIAVVGDVASYFRIVFGEVPRLYTRIWSRSIAECYEIYGNAPNLNLAFATLIPAVALVASGKVPRRLLLVVSLLACGLFVFFFQRKGFPYHLHPVTAGAHLVWLVVLAWAAERAMACRVWRRGAVAAAVGVVLLGVAVGLRARAEASRSEAAVNRWDIDGASAELRAQKSYFDHFPAGDFFAWDLRRAARFLREHTAPDERVQTYGMDPYLLFLAQRASASPYTYSFELDVDAALAGGSAGKPNDADSAWLIATAKRNDAAMLRALEQRPPAAFALMEHAPFSYPEDVLRNFDTHCPETAAFMHARYRRAATFGAAHVWMRDDIAGRGQTDAP
jgi:hypothetical protein